MATVSTLTRLLVIGALLCGKETFARALSSISRHFALHSRCPLWVKSRHLQCKQACPLYPQKRHQMRRMECPLYLNDLVALLAVGRERIFTIAAAKLGRRIGAQPHLSKEACSWTRRTRNSRSQGALRN